MAMTTTDKLGIANLGIQGIQGLLGGLDNSGEKATQQSADDELFQQLLAMVQNQGNVEQDLSSEQLQRAMAFTNANPLGAENDYRKSNSLGRAGMEAFSGRQLAGPTDPGIAASMGGKVPSLATGFMDRPGVRESYSDANVDKAISDRRIATAGIDPRAAVAQDPSSAYANSLFDNLSSSNQLRRGFAQNQTDLVNDRRDSAVVAEKDEPGFWKKLGGAVLPIAGAAASFIPGVGPLAGMALSAAGGAAGGALTGGKKGALVGGAGGALAGYGLEKMQGNRGATQLQDPSSYGPDALSGTIMGIEPKNFDMDVGGPPPLAGKANTNFNGLAPSIGARSATSGPTGGSANSGSPSSSTPSFFGQQQSNPNQFNFGTPKPQFDFSKMTNPSVQSGTSSSGMNPATFASPTALKSSMQSAPAQMPLVQSGMGYNDNPTRTFETIGDVDPERMKGKAQVAAMITSLIGGGGMRGGNQQLGLPAGPTQSGLPAAPTRLGLPSGQYNMPQTGTAGRPLQLPQNTQSSNEQVVAKLMEAMKAYKSDPKGAQDLVSLMQPYLKGIR